MVVHLDRNRVRVIALQYCVGRQLLGYVTLRRTFQHMIIYAIEEADVWDLEPTLATDSAISIRYVKMTEQWLNMLTKGSFTRVQWRLLLQLIQLQAPPLCSQP